MEKYLEENDFIDISNVKEFALSLVEDGDNNLNKAKKIYYFVRDEISHSSDIGDNRLRKYASEVLKYKHGICFAKSILLVALLRANNIPAGFGYALIAVSAMLFTAHFFIFHDAYNIFFYLFHEVAFIPIQVIIVGLILDKILENKEKEKMMKKLNMVIGLFFSEVGADFVRIVSCHDTNLQNSIDNFKVNSDYSLKDLIEIKKVL